MQASTSQVTGGELSKKKRKGGRVRQRKILVIGAKGCGKTSIMSRYTRNAMPEPALESSTVLADGALAKSSFVDNHSIGRNTPFAAASSSMAGSTRREANPSRGSPSSNVFEMTVLAKGQEYCLSLEEVCYEPSSNEEGYHQSGSLQSPLAHGSGDVGATTSGVYSHEESPYVSNKGADASPLLSGEAGNGGGPQTSDFDPRWAIGVAAIVVVYAVDDYQSLAVLQRLREEMLLCGCLSPPYDRNCPGTSADIVTVLVGNKADVAVSNREVESADAQHLARAWGISHFEVSAKYPNFATIGGMHKTQSQDAPHRAYGPSPSAHDSHLDTHHPHRAQSQGATSNAVGGGGTAGQHHGAGPDGAASALGDGVGDSLYLPGLFFEPRLASEDSYSIEGLFQYIMSEIGRKDGT